AIHAFGSADETTLVPFSQQHERGDFSAHLCEVNSLIEENCQNPQLNKLDILTQVAVSVFGGNETKQLGTFQTPEVSNLESSCINLTKKSSNEILDLIFEEAFNQQNTQTFADQNFRKLSDESALLANISVSAVDTPIQRPIAP